MCLSYFDLAPADTDFCPLLGAYQRRVLWLSQGWLDANEASDRARCIQMVTGVGHKNSSIR